jgi:hypothetical protein
MRPTKLNPTSIFHEICVRHNLDPATYANNLTPRGFAILDHYQRWYERHGNFAWAIVRCESDLAGNANGAGHEPRTEIRF